MENREELIAKFVDDIAEHDFKAVQTVADDIDESLLQRLGWIFNRVSMLISDLRGEE